MSEKCMKSLFSQNKLSDLNSIDLGFVKIMGMTNKRG